MSETAQVEHQSTTAEAAPSKPELPTMIDLNQLLQEHPRQLHERADAVNIRLFGGRPRDQMAGDLATVLSRRGVRVEAEGVVDQSTDGQCHLRWAACSYKPGAADVWIPPALVRRYQIRPGQGVRAVARAPRDKERQLTAEELLSIEGIDAAEWQPPAAFDKLTALFPDKRILLDNKVHPSVSSRVIDLIAPLGKGQRGLIVASPRSGKTILLKDIARSISVNHPEVVLLVLLVDERPEEVTDFEESVNATIFSSTFDEPPTRHIQTAELVSERAKRLVETGKDVVILLDSITRLARGYNAMMGGKGRIMSGGLDAKALQKPRKFFGAARNVEEGGSLTIVATALVETESRMDDVIFEEFKGTGNMEVYLDREMAERRIYPAIHSLKSGTRKDELLYHPDEYRRVMALRRQMAQLPPGEAMETLIKNIKRTQNNAELLLTGLR